MPMSPAEKQAAYRARQKQIQEAVAQGDPQALTEALGPLLDDVPAVDINEEPPERPKRTPKVTLEAYVKQTRWEALQYSIAIGETDAPTKVGDLVLEKRRTDRLARAERYARWRYEGFLSGEVASL